MIPPGLLPEDGAPRRTPALRYFAAVTGMAILALLGAAVQISRLARERDIALERLRNLEPRIAPPPTRTPPAPQVPDPAGSPAGPGAGPPAPPSFSPPGPDLRVAAPRPEEALHLAQGLQEFRAGRYDQAERHFFRDLPESILYLALTSLAQGNYREAIGFLSRAMTLDPQWLRKIRPSDLFGSTGAYQAMVQSLEDQLSRDPTNPDLKTLLAYLRFHDQGPPYAQALLLEATASDPAHEASRVFLKALEP